MNFAHSEVATLDPNTMRTLCEEYMANNYIDPETSERLGVKRGLRNPDGTGVLAGLTNVCDVVGYKKDQEGHIIPIPGKLIYRGVPIDEIVDEAYRNDRFVFEEVIWLLLIPDWSLGSYISQSQLASLLGVGTEATSLQDVTEFQLDAKGLQRVQPESARDGYLYFQLNTGSAGADAPVLVVGFQKDKFFDDAIPVELQLTIPAHDVTIRLSGTVSARTVSLTAPTSRMKDDDIQTLVQIRETIQSVLQFVQNAS